MKIDMRGFWAVPVIVGIAVMLSMSTLGTAYAEKQDAVCTPFPNMAGVSHRCNNIPAVGDHIHFITTFLALCGADVTEVNQLSGDRLQIKSEVTHGNGPCKNFIGFIIAFNIPGTL